jgi:hypothetical protein
MSGRSGRVGSDQVISRDVKSYRIRKSQLDRPSQVSLGDISRQVWSGRLNPSQVDLLQVTSCRFI